MADSNNSTASDKKVKTEQTAAETIVGDASAEIKDGVESEVKVDETVDVPEEQAEAAKPQHVAKENRRGGKAVRRTRSSRNAARMQRQSTQDFLRSVRTSAREMKKSQANCTT